MTEAATIPVWDALAQVINTGANPPKHLNQKRVHRGSAPGATLSYFVLGQAPAMPGGYYGDDGSGEDGQYRIHCWARTITEANELFAWFKRLVDDKRLTIDGHTMVVSGLLVKITDAPGPADATEQESWQVDSEYQVETLEAP